MAQATASKPSELLGLLKDAAWEWYEDKTFRLGAALAYYAVFSLAPLLLVAISVAGLIFGEAAARGELVAQIKDAVGPTVARAIEEALSYVHVSGSGTLTTLIGIGVVLVSATWVFGQLQDALNTIWEVKARKGRGWLGVVKDRLAPFLMVLVCGALLLGLLLLNAGLAVVGRLIPDLNLPGGFYLWRALDLAVTLGVTTVLFALVYKVLPDVSLDWSDVWLGAFVTAVLFLLGNWLIGLYLSLSGVASIYGAAGSLVVILLWVYYSSQVLLFGAELTHTYALRDGTPRQPKPHAEPLTGEDRARQGMQDRPEHQGARRDEHR